MLLLAFLAGFECSQTALCLPRSPMMAPPSCGTSRNSRAETSSTKQSSPTLSWVLTASSSSPSAGAPSFLSFCFLRGLPSFFSFCFLRGPPFFFSLCFLRGVPSFLPVSFTHPLSHSAAGGQVKTGVFCLNNTAIAAASSNGNIHIFP